MLPSEAVHLDSRKDGTFSLSVNKGWAGICVLGKTVPLPFDSSKDGPWGVNLLTSRISNHSKGLIAIAVYNLAAKKWFTWIINVSRKTESPIINLRVEWTPSADRFGQAYVNHLVVLLPKALGGTDDSRRYSSAKDAKNRVDRDLLLRYLAHDPNVDDQTIIAAAEKLAAEQSELEKLQTELEQVKEEAEKTRATQQETIAGLGKTQLELRETHTDETAELITRAEALLTALGTGWRTEAVKEAMLMLIRRCGNADVFQGEVIRVEQIGCTGNFRFMIAITGRPSTDTAGQEYGHALCTCEGKRFELDDKLEFEVKGVLKFPRFQRGHGAVRVEKMKLKKKDK